MSSTKWAFGLTGDWSDKTRWTGGVTPTSADDVTIDATGAYQVNLTTAQSANSLTFNSISAKLYETATGNLTVAGAFNLQAGTVKLYGASSLGSAKLTGGELQLLSAAPLGTTSLAMSGGELSALASNTLAAQVNISGNAAGNPITIAAGAGATFDVGSGGWKGSGAYSRPTLQIGASNRTGTVVWHSPAGSGSKVGLFLHVAGGTLKAGDANISQLTNVNGMTIDTGATFDAAGHSLTIYDLYGGGSIIDSGGPAALTIDGGSNGWRGDIKGAISVTYAGNVHVYTPQSYTGGSSITDMLVLVGAGAISGPINLSGALYNDDSAGVVLKLGVISGAGELRQTSAATTELDQADPNFTGTTYVSSGKLVLGAANALGKSTLTLAGGELLATTTQALNAITLAAYNPAIIAAAGGQTLTLKSLTLQSGGSADTTIFGDKANAGTVVLGGGGGDTIDNSGPIHVKVAAGTLRGSDFTLGDLLSVATDISVAAGATLDTGPRDVYAPNLTAAGTVTNTSGSASRLFTEKTTQVTGVVTGNLSLEVHDGVTTLSGANTYIHGTTIDSGATLNLGLNAAAGSVVGAIDDEGALVFKQGGAVTAANVISGAGGVHQSGPGATTLTGNNTFSGATFVTAGQLIVGKVSALGTGDVLLQGGELVASANLTLGESFTVSGVSGLAAANGTTLTLADPASLLIDSSAKAVTLTFGDAAHAGTVNLAQASTSIVAGNPIHLRLAYGTLKSGGSSLDAIAGAAADVRILAGTTLDLAGYGANTPNLTSAGLITNSTGTMATLDLHGSSAATGAITGKLQVVVDDGISTLSGADTYSGGTFIAGGATLRLGAGGAVGALAGVIDDEGSFAVNETGAVTVAGVISGAGQVTQFGLGTTTLSGLNTYSGGTSIARGVLVAANASALGTGVTTMTGGELVGANTMTLTNGLHTTGTVALAAAHGKTLTLNLGDLTVDAGRIFFGDAVNDGGIIVSHHGAFKVSDPANTNYELRAGLVSATDGTLGTLFGNAASTKIDVGATYAITGSNSSIQNLTGAGVITSSVAGADVHLFGTTNFSGSISGTLSVSVLGTTILSGAQTFSGTLFNYDSSLTLSGTVAETVYFVGGGTLILTTPSNFTGKITNFASGSTVDLRNIATASGVTTGFDAGTGVFTISDGTHNDTLNFGASSGLVASNFAVSADGVGGANVSWQTAAMMGARGPASHQAFVGAMAAMPSAAHAQTSHASAASWRGAATLLARPGLAA